LGNEDAFFRNFFSSISRQLDLEDKTGDPAYWDPHSYVGNLTRASTYMEDYILKQVRSPIFFAFDEANRILSLPFATDFFGMFRAWHENGRSSKNKTKWEPIDIIALVVTTSSHEDMIADKNLSPFNIAKKLTLTDFSGDDIEKLNKRHKRIFPNHCLEDFFTCTAGHPFLVNQSFYWISERGESVENFFSSLLDFTGAFGEHLQALEQGLKNADQSETLESALKTVIGSQEVALATNKKSLLSLYRAGLLKLEGSSVSMRNDLYKNYFSNVFGLA